MARDRGQSTVELVLVLPVVVLAALALVQIGLVARDHLLVWHAARESARAAAVDPTVAVARTAARAASSSLDPTRLTVDVVVHGSQAGDLLTATVVYRSPTDVPLVGAAVGDVTVRAGVTMRLEQS